MKKASLKQKGDSIFLGRDGSGFGRASTRFEAKASADLIELLANHLSLRGPVGLCISLFFFTEARIMKRHIG